VTNGTRFGEIVSFHIGGGWGQEAPTTEESNPAFVIRGTDIPGARHGDVANVPLRFHKPGALAKRQLQAGDIVFESSGGSKGQPVGRALLITDSLISSFDYPVICASFCKMIRPDATQVDPAFLYYTLLDDYANGTLSEYQVQSTGITNFQWKTFLQHRELVLAPTAVQRQISAVLGAIDDLIENNRRRIEVLEEMAQAIYREWFVHFRFPGHEDATFVDSPLGPIPEGWGTTQLGARFAVSLGGTPPRKNTKLWSGNVPWFNSSAVNQVRVLRGVEHITEEAVLNSNTKLWPRGSTLIAITGATLGQVSRLAIDACGNQSVVAVSDKDDVWTDYLFSAIRDRINDLIVLAGGAAQQHINKGIVDQFSVLSPPTALIQEFKRVARPMNDLLEDLLRQVDQIESVRNLLLPKLVSGEIDVSQLDLDAVLEGAV